VVTCRANRRLGAIDSEVVREATQTLVERFLAPADRGEPRFVSERAARPRRLRRGRPGLVGPGRIRRPRTAAPAAARLQTGPPARRHG
jgi:hypothetical protein